jgi:hypothetical protein
MISRNPHHEEAGSNARKRNGSGFSAGAGEACLVRMQHLQEFLAVTMDVFNVSQW